MCWQCAKTPEEWLNIFDSFRSIGWYFGPECGDGVFEFYLENKVYHTNPEAEPVEWMIDHIPGEYDGFGNPWFLEGHYDAPPGSEFHDLGPRR